MSFADWSKANIFSLWGRIDGGSDGKASAYNAGDPGSIPGSGRSPGEGNGNPLQYSCLEYSMNGGAWWATAQGVTKTDMTERLHSLWGRRGDRLHCPGGPEIH